jgi:hypothetical protein
MSCSTSLCVDCTTGGYQTQEEYLKLVQMFRLYNLKNKDYTAAADVIKNSAWAAQIGDRANGIINKIIS